MSYFHLHLTPAGCGISRINSSGVSRYWDILYHGGEDAAEVERESPATAEVHHHCSGLFLAQENYNCSEPN